MLPPFRSLLGLTLLMAAPSLPAQRQLTVQVAHEFGGLQATPSHELAQVGGIIRTARGQYLVMNGRPLEVRLYDATGKVVQRIGRAGEGPGEFRSGGLIAPWTGDSVLTLSSGTRRWMLFGLNGKLIREWPMDSTHPHPVATRMQDWAFTRTGMIGSRGCMQPVVGRIPAPSPWIPRETMTDAAGRIWVRLDALQWQIYSPAAQLLGVATFPKDFTVRQFSGDLVIGDRMDTDGAEYVTALRVGLPAAPEGAPPCILPAASGERIAVVKQAAGLLRSAGEAAYADNGIYPSSVPSKYTSLLSEDVTVTILKATKQGWGLVVRDKQSTARCVFSFGDGIIPGWQDGTIACAN